MYLLTICIFSLEKCVFRTSHFLIKLFPVLFCFVSASEELFSLVWFHLFEFASIVFDFGVIEKSSPRPM